MNSKKYVIGLAFNKSKDKLVLIEKNRPEWQKGKYNGVGGKVEPEDSDEFFTMVREFEEETGLKTKVQEWYQFAVMLCNNDIMGGHSTIYCFRRFNDDIELCETQESETISKIQLNFLSHFPLTPKLNYLIPMALDEDVEFNEIKMLR